MKILIADDHPVVLQGIHSYLTTRHYFVVGTCNNGIETWNSIVAFKPDVAILDQTMPGMTGIQIAERVRDEKLGTKIILLTMHKEKILRDKALAIGIVGYLLKDFALDELDLCLQAVDRGLSYYSRELSQHMTISEEDNDSLGVDKLTPTERKILQVIAAQKTSQEIAEMLFISLKTVEKHRSNIIKKLNLPHTGSSLAVWAAKNVK